MDSDKKILELIKTTACKYLPDAEVYYLGHVPEKILNLIVIMIFCDTDWNWSEREIA